jgi:hypothetical protein
LEIKFWKNLKKKQNNSLKKLLQKNWKENFGKVINSSKETFGENLKRKIWRKKVGRKILSKNLKQKI